MNSPEVSKIKADIYNSSNVGCRWTFLLQRCRRICKIKGYLGIKAGKDLRKANRMNKLEPVSEYLTVHTVGVQNSGSESSVIKMESRFQI